MIFNLLTDGADIKKTGSATLISKQAVETNIEQLLIAFTEILHGVLSTKFITRDGLDTDKDDFLLGNDLTTKREAVLKFSQVPLYITFF